MHFDWFSLQKYTFFAIKMYYYHALSFLGGASFWCFLSKAMVKWNALLKDMSVSAEELTVEVRTNSSVVSIQQIIQEQCGCIIFRIDGSKSRDVLNKNYVC